MTRHRRSPLSRFLFIHGPDVTCWVMLTIVMVGAALDFAYQPHGFTRFVVAFLGYAIHRT